MKSQNIVTITTAVELTDTHTKKIVSAIEKKLGSKATEVTLVVDPKELGGIKVAINNTEYNGTLRGKLDAVHQKMLKNLQ